MCVHFRCDPLVLEDEGEETKRETFARVKKLDDPQQGWKWRLVLFGERLFGHRRKGLQSELPVAYDPDSIDSSKIRPIDRDIKLRNLAPAKPEAKELSTKKRETMDDLISACILFILGIVMPHLPFRLWTAVARMNIQEG
jgi:hypothetical protein